LTDAFEDAFDFTVLFLFFVLLRFGAGFFALDFVTAVAFCFATVFLVLRLFLLLAFEDIDIATSSSKSSVFVA